MPTYTNYCLRIFKKFEWLTITTSTETTKFTLISQKLLVQLNLEEYICEAQDLGYPSVSNYISMITHRMFVFHRNYSIYLVLRHCTQFDSRCYLKLETQTIFKTFTSLYRTTFNLLSGTDVIVSHEYR